MADYRVEAVVIGAGVVGLAIARALAQRGLETLVLERAPHVGSETSSRNSEVIHAGIYYPPGSLKAQLCVAGKALLYDYLAQHQLGYSRCGKLIVATSAAETAQLALIAERAHKAGVDDLQPLSAQQVNALERNVSGVQGLLSPSTGIVDSHQLMLQLQADLEADGGALAVNTEVQGGALGVAGEHRLETSDGASLGCRILVNAAGLYARDVLLGLLPAAQHGDAPEQHFAIGHYYSYSGKAPFVRLVYPTPSPGGLGIHATIDLAGQVRFGPDVRWLEHVDYQFDDSQRKAFAAAIRRYYPDVDSERLQPAYTGIRPKLHGQGQGDTDFTFLTPAEHGYQGFVSLHGIESPGLTASLAIAERVAASI
ncbi:MAG: NAD(P)/FAD-dependent oxidoreductase [Pseudomonadales bacterium]